jgi:hypothetical protein
MARAKTKVNFPIPDIPATNKEIHKAMTKFTFDALKTWVLATVDPVPVWSGAARASFLFLAAKAETSFQINPVAPDPPGSRIWLGVSEQASEVFADISDGKYGWTWESDLAHIGIVEDRVHFIAAGLESIADKQPDLPPPTWKGRAAQFLRRT